MASYEYSLPVEQWRQVLVNNSPGDLCNVVLVSRHINSVASLPELWAGMKVNTRKVRENGLAEFYNINRFKKVKEIDLNRDEIVLNCGELERLLKEIPGSPLESANFGRRSLSGMSAELLATAVSHLHIADLHWTHLTTDQCVALLKASLSSTTLKNLNLEAVDLSGVPAELLANSISRLHEVDLHLTNLTNDQCVALLKANLSAATLKNVNLMQVNLSKVPAELLANSISRLQKVILCGRDLKITTDQLVALLKAIPSSATLKNVNLMTVNLSEVPAELLANSISRLHEVDLHLTNLTNDQCVALLKANLSSSATLKNVVLMYEDLSLVPAELLANSISRLQEANLFLTYLTPEQCVAILEACHSSTTLHRINLSGNFIREILPSDKQYLLSTLQARMSVSVDNEEDYET